MNIETNLSRLNSVFWRDLSTENAPFAKTHKHFTHPVVVHGRNGLARLVSVYMQLVNIHAGRSQQSVTWPVAQGDAGCRMLILVLVLVCLRPESVQATSGSLRVDGVRQRHVGEGRL